MSNIVTTIRRWYETDPLSKEFFDYAAARRNDTVQTTFSRLLTIVKTFKLEDQALDDLGNAQDLAWQLHGIGCADLVTSTRGRPIKLRWKFSLKSLGQVARGESDTLLEPDPMLLAEAEEA